MLFACCHSAAQNRLPRVDHLFVICECLFSVHILIYENKKCIKQKIKTHFQGRMHARSALRVTKLIYRTNSVYVCVCICKYGEYFVESEKKIAEQRKSGEAEGCAPTQIVETITTCDLIVY